MEQAKSQNKKEYFLEYTKIYLEQNENIDNFKEIKKQYTDAYDLRKAKIDNLYKEISVIKKLKV